MGFMNVMRAATLEQLQQCLAIREEVFVKEQGVDPAIEIDRYDDSPLACVHMLLTVEGQPAATGRIIRYEERTAKLQRIAVLPEYRGIGAGRRLVEAMEEQAWRDGFRRIVLDAQCHAEPFYVKLGYRTVSDEPFLDAGIPHVRMTKEKPEPAFHPEPLS
nr:GNAT family N-acetyltransferase [Paenibacillus sp. 32O-W]